MWLGATPAEPECCGTTKTAWRPAGQFLYINQFLNDNLQYDFTAGVFPLNELMRPLGILKRENGGNDRLDLTGICQPGYLGQGLCNGRGRENHGLAYAIRCGSHL